MFQSSVQRSSSHAVARVCSVPAPDPSGSVALPIIQALPSDDDEEEEERDMSNGQGEELGVSTLLSFPRLAVPFKRCSSGVSPYAQRVFDPVANSVCLMQLRVVKACMKCPSL